MYVICMNSLISLINSYIKVRSYNNKNINKVTITLKNNKIICYKLTKLIKQKINYIFI